MALCTFPVTKPVAASARRPAAPKSVAAPRRKERVSTQRRKSDAFATRAASAPAPAAAPPVSPTSEREWFSLSGAGLTRPPPGRAVVRPVPGESPLLGAPLSVLDPAQSYEANLRLLQRDGLPRLPSLTSREREVESRFCAQLEADLPQAVAAVRLLGGTEDTQFFEADAVKRLDPGYGTTKPPANDAERDYRLRFNHPLQAGAVVLNRLAFLQRLDELAALPPGDARRSVFVTGGGCGAGKGGLADQVRRQGTAPFGAVFDAAGESEGLEAQWVLEACAARGLSAVFGFAAGDPLRTYANVIDRAGFSGRVVDVETFARSYVEGRKSFAALISSPRFVALREAGQASAFAIDPGAFDPRSRTDPDRPEYPDIRVLNPGEDLTPAALPAVPDHDTIVATATALVNAEAKKQRAAGQDPGALLAGALGTVDALVAGAKARPA